eukprot:COSAG02_NODE_4711_length_5071_cov_293.065567_5_plen_95_part_00
MGKARVDQAVPMMTSGQPRATGRFRLWVCFACTCCSVRRTVAHMASKERWPCLILTFGESCEGWSSTAGSFSFTIDELITSPSRWPMEAWTTER